MAAEKSKKRRVVNEMEVTLAVMGGKWKPILLYFLGDKGKLRFGELKKLLPSVSHKVLTNQLRELENDGLLLRKTYAVVPPKVEYELSPKGETLLPILELMCQWGEANMTEEFEMTKPLCCSEKNEHGK